MLTLIHSDNKDGAAISKFGASVMKYLIDAVEDPNLNLAPNEAAFLILTT